MGTASAPGPPFPLPPNDMLMGIVPCPVPSGRWWGWIGVNIQTRSLRHPGQGKGALPGGFPHGGAWVWDPAAPSTPPWRLQDPAPCLVLGSAHSPLPLHPTATMCTPSILLGSLTPALPAVPALAQPRAASPRPHCDKDQQSSEHMGPAAPNLLPSQREHHLQNRSDGAQAPKQPMELPHPLL